MSFLDEHNEAERLTWEVIRQEVPDLANPRWEEAPDAGRLFCGQLDRHLATLLLRRARAGRSYRFFSDENLHSMAVAPRPRGRGVRDSDVPEEAGLYVFTRLEEPDVLKVGESSDLRTRIEDAHLRYGRQVMSDVIAYYKHDSIDWPDAIRIDRITLLVFPLRNSSPEERQLVEAGLHKLLIPAMK